MKGFSTENNMDFAKQKAGQQPANSQQPNFLPSGAFLVGLQILLAVRLL